MSPKHWGSKIVFAFVAAVTLLITGVNAQDEDVFEVEEVIFTGTRVEEEGVPLDKLPASVLTIKGEDLKKTQDNSLPETLSKYAGFHYMDLVGLGSGANLHLRGFGEFPGNIVLLDGVRLNESDDHKVFWKAIPLDAIEKIEVIKGGVSSTYGEGALTGVVNIITKKSVKQNTLNMLWGELTKKELSVTGSAPVGGKLNVLVNGYYETNKGYRAQSDFDGKGALLKLSNASERAKYSLLVNVHKHASDVPDGLTAAQLAADEKQSGNNPSRFENSNSTVSFQTTLKGKGFSLSPHAYYRKRDSRGVFPTFFSENETDGKSYGGVLQLALNRGKHAFVTGVEYGKEYYFSNSIPNFGDGSPDKINKKNFAFYAQDIFQASPRLSVSAAVRRDDVTYDLDVFYWPAFARIAEEKKAKATSPKFGVNFAATQKINMYASYAKSFLSPTGYQFTGVIPPYLANPNLEPTTSNEHSVGFRVKSRATKTDVNFFQMKTTNEIISFCDPVDFDPCGNENVNVKRTGAELTVEQQFTGNLSGLLSAAFLDAVMESDKSYNNKNINGKKMPFAPQSTVGLGLYYSPSTVFDLNVNSTFVNDFYPLNDLNNETKAKNYNLTNLKAAYKTKWGSLSAYLNNVFNTKYSSYPSTNGASPSDANYAERFRPQPSRSFGLSVQYNF